MSLQGGRGYGNPVDLAFDSDGAMYVVSRGGSDSDELKPSKRVTKSTVDEQFLGEFSSGRPGRTDR